MKKIFLVIALIVFISTNAFAATLFDPSINPVWHEVRRTSTEVNFVDTCPQHIKTKDSNRVVFMVSNANIEIGLLTIETWEVKIENNEFYGQQLIEISEDLKTKKVLNQLFIASPWKKLSQDNSIYHCFKYLIDKGIVKITNCPSEKDPWNYLGIFVLRKNINPTTDYLLLNHLTPYNGKQQNGDYFFYDVYYKHDHSTDEGTGQKEYSDWAFDFKGKVVMLGKDGTALKNQGIFSGEIITDVSLRTKGSFGVYVNSFRIHEPESGKVLFDANINSRDVIQEMFMNTSLTYMLNMSAPHPVAPVSLRGYREFNYK